MIDRYAFHLENAAGEDARRRCSRRSASSTTARRRRVPPQVIVPRGVGRRVGARGVPLRAARRARRGARARARREAAAAGARAAERASSRSSSDRLPGRDEAAAARRGARGAARGAQPRGAADPDRVLRHLARRWARTSSPRWSSSRTAQPKKAHYRKFGDPRRATGQDDFAAMAEVISRRFARLAAGPGRRSSTSRSRQAPNLVVIDGGKGQLSAALAAMQAYDLPRVAVISLAKRDRGGVRAGPGGADRCSTGSSPALQLLQRIRDEAHRFAVGFHRQRREREARESIFDRLEGVGPARRRALLRHFGSAERVAGGDARRSSRACPGCRRRRRGRSTRSCTRRAAHDGAAADDRAARGAAADRRPPVRAVLRRQRALGERHVVPEPRRVAARLPADRLGAAARRAQLLAVRRIVVLSPWTGAPPTASTGGSCCS